MNKSKRTVKQRANPWMVCSAIFVLCFVSRLFWGDAAPSKPFICSHKGLASGRIAPKTETEWKEALQTLQAARIGCMDIDVTPVQDVLYIGHPTEVQAESPDQAASRITYTDFLRLLKSYPSLSSGVEMKPVADAPQGAEGVQQYVQNIVSIAGQAAKEGVAGRVSFQKATVEVLEAIGPDRLASLRGEGVVWAAPVRQFTAAPEAGKADQHCHLGSYTPAQIADMFSEAGVLMPAKECVSSAHVRQSINAWHAQRTGRGLIAEVHVWVVDSCVQLAMLQGWAQSSEFPVEMDRVISNEPLLLRTCKRIRP